MENVFRVHDGKWKMEKWKENEKLLRENEIIRFHINWTSHCGAITLRYHCIELKWV